ncbi:hypothetical protein M885DRAFT_564371 [Pelagophyceae sp. CCMP2097]|nr:hypothetical protein M885DRAFT_564371 [Pelagophyceae sp. CCMP2097]
MLDFASTPPRGSLGQRAFAAAERVSKCRACVVVGLAVASALCAASVTGLSRRLRVRESQDTQADYDCQRARDAVSGWGERLAFEAASLGSLMQREEQKEKEHHEQYDRYTDETHHPLPFLVPGSLTTAQLSARLEIMAAEFEQNPPAVLWSPTVQHEDRLEYEEYATRAFGRSVFITDDWALNSTLAKTPAPIRETYNPLTTLYVAASVSPNKPGA